MPELSAYLVSLFVSSLFVFHFTQRKPMHVATPFIRLAFLPAVVLCFLISSPDAFPQPKQTADSLSAPTNLPSRFHFDDSPLARRSYHAPVNPWKLTAITTAAVSTLGASYLFLKNTWWNEQSQGFHFDQGKDLRYSHGIDKLAHFYGGAIGTDAFYGGLRWADMSEQGAYIYGAVLSSFVQIAMEIKDGFAPRWGFSVYDVASGMLGAMLPVGKRYVPLLRDVDVKLSYYRPSKHYFEKVNQEGTYNDDYEGQTYWIALRTNNMLPASLERYWPDFLAIAVGFSLDTDSDGQGGGHTEIFLGLDYDLTSLIPSNSAFWEGVKHYLNYVHLPAPAVRIAPSVVWFGLYF